jgi:hypothetical protein
MSVNKTKRETIVYSVTETDTMGNKESEFYTVQFKDGKVTGINIPGWAYQGNTLPARLLAHLQLLLAQLTVEGCKLSYKIEEEP